MVALKRGLVFVAFKNMEFCYNHLRKCCKGGALQVASIFEQAV